MVSIKSNYGNEDSYHDYGYFEKLKESNSLSLSTSSKVGIAVGLVLGVISGIMIAHFGSGFPLNSLNTAGIISGCGIGGAVLGQLIVLGVEKYYRNKESRYDLSSGINILDDDEFVSSDDDSRSEIITFAENYNSDSGSTTYESEDDISKNKGEVYFRNGLEIKGTQYLETHYNFGDE